VSLAEPVRFRHPYKMRSPIPYYGSKGLLAQTIAGALDSIPHRHYVEACAGSLAVLLAKKRVQAETVNDLDARLQTFWRMLRDQPVELERVCSLTPHSRAERLTAQEFPDGLDDLEVARRVYVALTQGRHGSLNRTGWRHDVTPDSHPYPVRLQRFAGRLAPVAARLASVSLECRPAVEIIEAYGRGRGNLLYVDPPYQLDARARNYALEMSDAGHRELAEACLSADATVVVSGYPDGVWDSALADWHRYELAAVTRQGKAEYGSARTEVLWSNRPLKMPVGEAPVSSHEVGQRVETPARCPGCAAVLRHPKTGRKRRWCAPACRERARRQLAAAGTPATGG
jgi:DNA adenine methylase